MYTFEKIYNRWNRPILDYGGFNTRLPEIVLIPGSELVGLATRGGESCVGYRSKIRQNQSATTDRYVVYHNVKCQPAFHLRTVPAKTPSGSTWKYGFVCASASTIPEFGTKLKLPDAPTSSEMIQFRSDLASKFETKARGMVASLEGGVFLGELPETIALFASPAKAAFLAIKRYLKRIYRFVKKVNRRRVSKEQKMKSVAEYIESAYLMLTFAILPLLGDVQSAAEALVQYKKRVVRDFNVRMSRLFNHDNSSRLNGTYITTKVTRVRGQIVACLSADATLPPGTKSRLAELLGVDFRGIILDFVPTVWNLIPFSFVLDYFSNIGAVLTSKFGAIPQVAWASTTYTTERYRRATIVPPAVPLPAGNWTATGPEIVLKSPGLVEHTAKEIKRSSTIPTVSLEIDLDLSIRQWINVAALSGLASRIGRLLT